MEFSSYTGQKIIKLKNRGALLVFLFRKIFPVCALVLLSLIAEAHQWGIEVDFQHGKTLTEDEMATVVDLARQYGFDEISLIRTAPMPPSSNYLIIVREAAVANAENFYRYRELWVGSEKFFSDGYRQKQLERAQKKGAHIVDGFWGMYVHSIKFIPVRDEGKEYEIRVGEEVRYSELVRIIDAIRQGRIELSERMLEEDRRPNWKWPTHISLSYNNFHGATHVLHYGSSGSALSYYIQRRKEVLVVVGLSLSVANGYELRHSVASLTSGTL